MMMMALLATSLHSSSSFTNCSTKYNNVRLITLYYQTEFGTAIFEDVADVCYNMLDHLEQYKQYLDSMKLIHIPLHVKASVSTSSNIPTATADQPLGSQSTTATQGE